MRVVMPPPCKKSPRGVGSSTLESYFSPVETLVNIVFKLVPIDVTATTMAIEIPEAISAYSMAVVPLLSLRNHRSMATSLLQRWQ
jgi:hypothetical protein